MLELNTDTRGVVTLTLNRPEVHNALNAELIAALHKAFDDVAAQGARVLVLTGAGKSFSAGADLNWMRSMAEASEEENRADAARLAAMLRALDELPCPTIAKVNGAAFGGGVGLVACCDISVAAEHAVFSLSEVRLGLIPATIAPFVIRRIGPGQARRWMLTAERFDAARAERIGLVNECVPTGELDATVNGMLDAVLAGGPLAQAECKRLIRRVSDHDDGDIHRVTAEWIARLRVSEEGQEGLGAFLEKRKPRWRS